MIRDFLYALGRGKLLRLCILFYSKYRIYKQSNESQFLLLEKEVNELEGQRNISFLKKCTENFDIETIDSKLLWLSKCIFQKYTK